MGRRALRKTDPSLDLTGHLTTIDHLPDPWDAATVFGRKAPLQIEVGSGKGLFLATAAEMTPEHNFLGVEISHKYARFAAARLAKEQLANAKLIDGDAMQVFREFLPDECAVAVHVYFPDPWWKKRQRKRRVMNEPFLRDVQRVLLPSGVLHFWSDVAQYYQTTLDLLREVTSLAGPFEVPERPADHDLDYRTHFERRMRQHGEPVYRVEFRKKE